MIGEECDDGVLGVSGDGCTSRCTFEIELWREATPVADEVRTNHAMAFDAARGVTVMFGGLRDNVRLAETWLWDDEIGQWRRVDAAASPSPRDGHAMAYDPVRQRVVLFGGQADGPTWLADTWEWDGVTWIQRSPATSPPMRAHAAMAFDPTHNKMRALRRYDRRRVRRYVGMGWHDVGAAVAVDNAGRARR